MSGLESLDTALQPVPLPTLTAEQTAWRGEELDDEAALGLVLADTQTAEAFIQTHNVVLDIERADNNFRAFGLPKNWPGVESQRAGLSMPIIMEFVEKLLAAIMLAFFSDPQPFLLTPTGKTTPEAARAKKNLLRWAIKESGFKEEIRKGLKSALLYGFMVARWGWRTVSRSKTEYGYAPGTKSVTRVEKSYEVSHPTFESIDLRNVLVDPALREQDVRKARYVIAQIFPDAQTVVDLANDPAYKNVPTRDELTEILAAGNSEPTLDSMEGSKFRTWRDNQAAKETIPQSADPTKAKLEILEYVTADRVITVLQRKIVLRNAPLEFGKTTFLSCAFIDVPGAMYGFGVSKLLAGEQYLQTSTVNSWLDVVALIVNPSFTAEQGLQTTAQNVKVSPGKILTGPKLTPIQIPSVAAEALNVLQTSELRSARRVGAVSGDNLPTQALRTAEGVQSFGQDVVNKLQYFIEMFGDLVFIPALEAFLEVCKAKLEPEAINNILSEMDGKAYEGDILEFYNGTCNIEVLASTKLAARRAAANLAPLIMNLVMAPAVQQALAAQGHKFNFAEFLTEVIELTGWDVNSLIVPASQEDIQRAMVIAAPQAAKAQTDAQSKAQLLDQQNQNELGQIEEKGVVQAGVAAVKHVFKEASEKSGGGIAG